MYASISGRVSDIETDNVVVECGGVGYEIFTNNTAINGIAIGKDVKFYTILSVREDAHVLYGFLSKEEKNMFKRLITVSGVGPKLALAILSGMSVNDLAIAIVASDEKALGRISGIGKKTAQRMILELQNTISNDEALQAVSTVSIGTQDTTADAIDVLLAMGFDSIEAAAAVALVKADGGTAEQMAMRALKSLDRQK